MPNQQKESEVRFDVANLVEPMMMSCSQVVEVAKSVGSDKAHKNVLRDARVMLLNLYGGDALARLLPEKCAGRFLSANSDSLFESVFGDGSTLSHVAGIEIKRDARGYIAEIMLDKDHATGLVSRYSDKLRMALIRRIGELEKALSGKTPEPARMLDVAERKLNLDLTLIDRFSDLMRVASSTRLRMYHRAAELHGCSVALLPHYAVDAPGDGPQSSSVATASLRELLKDANNSYREKGSDRKVMTASDFYGLMEYSGLAEHRSRPSQSKGADENGEKHFWTIVGDGEKYAKNLTDPKSPRQTQPHFFRGRFNELRRVLAGVVHQNPGWKAEYALMLARRAAAKAPRRLTVREAAERRDDLR